MHPVGGCPSCQCTVVTRPDASPSHVQATMMMMVSGICWRFREEIELIVWRVDWTLTCVCDWWKLMLGILWP